MKRLLPLALLLLVPGAAADCTQAEPCVLRVTLDDGVWFDAPDDHEATVRQHHWYLLDVLNMDDRSHALTLANHTLDAPGGDDGGPRSRHGPVSFAEPGNHTLRDDTARAEATLVVEPSQPPQEPGDPNPDPGPGDDPDGAPTDSGEPPERRKEVPAPLVLPALALAALAALAARRH